MRVAVVGAGIAGLGCARELKKNGCEVVVFEKSKGFGGRAATRRIGPYTFDHGATSIAPRGRALEPVMMAELDKSELVAVEKPIYQFAYNHIEPGDSGKNRISRYCYTSGINKLGKLLADGLDVRLETPIDTLEGFRVAGESFDKIVLAGPLPQMQTLLRTVRDKRTLEFAAYRACLSVMLGYRIEFDPPYHALIDPEQQSPMNWLSVESEKVPGGYRAPEGSTALVAQLGPDYSKRRFEATDAEIIADTIVDVTRLIGQAFRTPEVAEVQRWRYSQPESTLSFEGLNDPGERIVVTGDGTVGGRIELAFASGLQAAACVLG